MFADELTKMRACPAAVDWVGDRSRATAWADCDRADWMLWYWGRKYCKTLDQCNRFLTTTYACVQHLRPSMSPVAIHAMDVAEAWLSDDTAVRAHAERRHKATKVDVETAAFYTDLEWQASVHRLCTETAPSVPLATAFTTRVAALVIMAVYDTVVCVGRNERESDGYIQMPVENRIWMADRASEAVKNTQTIALGHRWHSIAAPVAVRPNAAIVRSMLSVKD
jgi:hypothetical protein